MTAKHNERGALSIDFLIGFTIFILAFVWIATMIPGMLIGLKANTIDYDAVAYRTGVILVEDPGWPQSPGWETHLDEAKDIDIIRFGLAVRKDSPNVLSQKKIDRFFNLSTPADPGVGFRYPDDYRPRVIFGDYPYRFNITLSDVQRGKIQSVGEILPEDIGTGGSRLNEYGYIRRLVKIKTVGNATIDLSQKKNIYLNNSYQSPGALYPGTNNVSTHTLSILLDIPKLKAGVSDPLNSADASRSHDPAYIIDPTQDVTVINISGFRSTMPADIMMANPEIRLMNISMKYKDIASGSMISVRNVYDMEIDGVPRSSTSDTYNDPVGFSVQDMVNLTLQPEDVRAVSGLSNNPVYLNMTFELGTYGAPVVSPFANNTNSTAFNFGYDPTNVTQPSLRDGIVEVAVW